MERETTMTDPTPKFDPIPRLQQIAATIEESGADIFDAPATAAYYINCAIKEIERLHRDYSCICNEMRRMMQERDEARRRLCEELMESEGNPMFWKGAPGAAGIAERLGWDCFKEGNNPEIPDSSKQRGLDCFKEKP